MSTPEADLLQVSPGATLADLKAAYRKAALAHHPDRNPHPDSSKTFRKITEAYRRLLAQAQAREPVRARRVSVNDRVGWLLVDVADLAKRWPDKAWSTPVSGLPGGVWLASAVAVIADLWDGPGPGPVEPVRETLLLRVQWCREQGQRSPLKAPTSRALARALDGTLDTLELRIHALTQLLR